MKKTALAICMALILCFFPSCIEPSKTSIPVSISDAEEVLTESREFYRNSSAIVLVNFLKTHYDAELGHRCTDVIVTRVLAGSTNVGAIIHCGNLSLKENGGYMMYLCKDDEGNFRLLNKQPMRVMDDCVIWNDGTVIPVDDIKSDIAEFERTIYAPGESYFYSTLRELVEAADVIVAATVSCSPRTEERTFKYTARGMTVQSIIEASVVSARVERVFKGKLSDGDRLDVVFAPSGFGSLYDASTHTPMTLNGDDVQQIQVSKRYVFFLVNGTSERQSYYFLINPVQGAVLADKTSVRTSYVNKAVNTAAVTCEDLFGAIDTIINACKTEG